MKKSSDKNDRSICLRASKLTSIKMKRYRLAEEELLRKRETALLVVVDLTITIHTSDLEKENHPWLNCVVRVSINQCLI